jgi:hypothetical protein
MTSDDVCRMLEDYPNYSQEIVKLNNDLHNIIRAMDENCRQMSIHGMVISGMPHSNKISDPVYNAFMETEKLTRNYMDEIRRLSQQIIEILKDKASVDCAMDRLTTYERSILEMRYIKRYGWQHIADETKYSDRQCRTIRDKALCKMGKWMT